MQALRFLDSISFFLKVGKPDPNILPWPNPTRSDRPWNINVVTKPG